METGERDPRRGRLRILGPRDGRGTNSLRRRVSAIGRQSRFSLFRAVLAAAMTGFLAVSAYETDGPGGRFSRDEVSEGFIGFALAAAAILLWKVWKILRSRRRTDLRYVERGGRPEDLDHVPRRVGEER